MVTRDPETGKFRSGDRRGEEDPYINVEHLYYSNSWGSDDGTGTEHDFDETDGRNSLKTVEMERPDDHLIEIHGVHFSYSDPAEGGKVLNWVANDIDPQAGGFVSAINDYGEDLIAQSAVEVDDTNGVGNLTSDTVWLPKPMLSTGKIACHKRAGTVDSGEIAATLYYTFREFDSETVVQQLLQNR